MLHHQSHHQIHQTTLLPDSAPKFAEIFLPVRHAAHPDPAAALHIGNITVKVFEDTSYELLTTILKAVRSC